MISSTVDMNKEHVKQLQDWLESYEINELLDENGKLKQEYANLAPKGTKRMSANPVSLIHFSNSLNHILINRRYLSFAFRFRSNES